MLTVKIELLAGRYHANPWGSHVNEAIVEWPPSPYRLVRAIYDSWKRKAPQMDESRVISILEKISSESPTFQLPEGRTFSIPAFLDLNDKSMGKKHLSKKAYIRDTFVVTNAHATIRMRWDSVILDEDEKKDLNTLLKNINFLGRSESLVRMEIDEPEDYSPNSFPISNQSPDIPNEKRNSEIVFIALPVPKEEFEKNAKTEEIWTDAITTKTSDLFRSQSRRKSEKKQFNEPLAMKLVGYYRKIDSLSPVMASKPPSFESKTNAVMYAIDSTVMAGLTETIMVSERIHRKLIGIYKKQFGEENLSPKFVGKDKEGQPLKGHRHIYIDPVDFDSDGFLDHVIIWSREHFDKYEMITLSSLKSVWQSDGKPDLKFIPVEMGEKGKMSFDIKSQLFRSETPFVPPRHYRKGRGNYLEWLKGEIRNETRYHNLPEPVDIRIIDRVPSKKNLAGKVIRWLDFKRARKDDIERQGYGFLIKFDDSVSGIFNLGYGAHYGLGLFIPEMNLNK
jgi:CRISPR-associated protein Csb2